MTPRQFEKSLTEVGLTQRSASKFFGVNERTVRRWVEGEPIPRAVQLLLEVMKKQSLMVQDVNAHVLRD